MMEKYNIIKTRQLAHTGAEIKLMKNLNFPFVIDMHGFFMVLTTISDKHRLNKTILGQLIRGNLYEFC